MTIHATLAQTDWPTQIQELQQILQELRPQLISAETELADQLAAINRFEFDLRTRLGHLTQQLESLEAEISDFRTLIRRRREEWLERNGYDSIVGEWGDLWEVVDETEGAEAADSYRYRDPEQRTTPKAISPDEAVSLKKLYRQLARRFHPDLAENEADRQHRTTLMIAINAAYAAADFARLEQLALEPDTVTGHIIYDSLQQQAVALLREIQRLERRLQEIQAEQKQLADHRSSRLMRRVEKAIAEGRDLIAEITADLKEKIVQTIVERDILRHELDNLENLEEQDPVVLGTALAEAIWDMTLDDLALGEDLGEEEWLYQQRGRRSYWDDNEDDRESYS